MRSKFSKVKLKAEDNNFVVLDPAKSLREFYEFKIENIRDDIDVRTESLKTELDNLREAYHKNLIL